MTLQEIEPFAWGYYHSTSDDASRRIAEGIYSFCKYLPLSIDPEIGLASVDRANGSFAAGCGVSFMCGDGIFFNQWNMEREIRENPAYEKELCAYRDFFAPLHTYKLFKDTYSENERALNENNTLWGGTWGGHSNPDYGLLLTLGTSGLRKKVEAFRPVHPEADFWYDSLNIVLDAVDLLGDRFRDYARQLAEKNDENREIYLRIAEALTTVPRQPAHDMMTALQLFYLVFTLDGRDSPGTFDQYIGPFFEKADRKEARKLLDGLWIGFHKTRAWNLCIGGSDPDFNDKSNALTYEILDIAETFGFETPNITMRCHRNTPDALYRRAAKVIGTGIGMPALYNDECVCPALEALGIPAEDSHLYAMNGCNQIDIQGKSHMGLEDGEVCLLKCLEYALFDGRCLITGKTVGLRTGNAAEFSSYDELFDAYKKQVENAVRITVTLANRSQKTFAAYAPNPLRSLLLEGCIEKGRDYKSGGPVYNHGQILTEGLADTADSLAVLRHFVFDTHKYTMEEVLDALEKDYAGYERMYEEFRSYPVKFGNDNDEVDEIASAVLSHFFTDLQNYRTFRDPVNGIYGGGLSTFQRTGRYGGTCGASASGRHARSGNIADSCGPVPGMDKKGPTAVIKSALKYDQKLAKSGFVLQLKFDKKVFCTDRGQEAFISIVKAYFSNGGQQLSVNVLDPQALLDAKEHPENHGGLIVRVGGYSAYFVNLPRDLQENIIARTTQTL